jgi:hypothetical protein
MRINAKLKGRLDVSQPEPAPTRKKAAAAAMVAPIKTLYQEQTGLTRLLLLRPL